jgi:hypothetical protein
MALNVKAILQAQRPKFIVAQFAFLPALELTAKLGDALVHEPLVYVGIAVQAIPLNKNSGRSLKQVVYIENEG